MALAAKPFSNHPLAPNPDMSKNLMWFRNDLRLNDNPALHHAVQAGEVLPVYILPSGLGGASRWWLHYSVQGLQKDLANMGVELILRSGNVADVLADLCEHCLLYTSPSPRDA